MGIDPDDVRAVNDDMTEVAIPNWRQRTVLGLADAALSAAKVAGWALVPVEATEDCLTCVDGYIAGVEAAAMLIEPAPT